MKARIYIVLFTVFFVYLHLVYNQSCKMYIPGILQASTAIGRL